MAKSIARGKALVAKFRGTPGVRDPEALAAYAGRVKKYRKAGKSVKEAMRLAAKSGGGDNGGVKPSDDDVSNKLWEQPNPNAFGKPYLSKRDQDVINKDPKKIDELIGQVKHRITLTKTQTRGIRNEEHRKAQIAKERERLRAYEAFKRYQASGALNSKGGREQASDSGPAFSGLTDADRKVLAQARQRKSIAEAYIKAYERGLETGNSAGKARAKAMLKELRKML